MTRFAIACAKNCLFRFERKYPDDNRPRKAIEAAEKYMRGEITVDELRAATTTAATTANAANAYAAYAAARESERKWQNKKLEQIIREYV